MTNLMDELPQLVISALLILLIGVLLALKVITPDNPVFVSGSGGLLLLIASYWLGNGLLRLSHTQTMKAAAQVQLIAPIPSAQPSPPVQLPPPAQPPAPELSYETTPLPAVAKPNETTPDHV